MASMKPSALVRVIARLPASQPLAEELDQWILESPVGMNELRNFRNQKEHLVGWLLEYNTRGYYGRRSLDGDAKAAYQRLQSAPALLWLAEALGEDPGVLDQAVKAVKAAPARKSSQCGALRKVIPWGRIEELVQQQDSRSRTR